VFKCWKCLCLCELTSPRYVLPRFTVTASSATMWQQLFVASPRTSWPDFWSASHWMALTWSYSQRHGPSGPHPESEVLLRTPQTCLRNPSKVLPIFDSYRRSRKGQAAELGWRWIAPWTIQKIDRKRWYGHLGGQQTIAHKYPAMHSVRSSRDHHMSIECCEMSLRVFCTYKNNLGSYQTSWYGSFHNHLWERSGASPCLNNQHSLPCAAFAQLL